MELCMREKAVFFLPVNILTVWSPSFLAARHTTVCLELTVWSPAFLAARHTTVCLDHGVVAGFLGRTTHYRVS